MKLNEEIKAGLAIALAGISNSLELSRIRLPKYKNASLYTIKSPNGEVDVTLSFNQGRPNGTDALDQVVNYLDEYEYGISYHGDMETDEDLLITICEMLNTYSSIGAQLKERGNNDYKFKLDMSAGEIADWWDSANITTQEAKSLSGACATLALLQQGSEIAPEDLMEKIIKEHTGFEAFKEDYLQNDVRSKWFNRKKEEIKASSLVDEIALITLATGTELVSNVFHNAYSLENTGILRYNTNTEEADEILGFENELVHSFHDREGLDKDINTLKKNIFSILLASCDEIDQPIKTMKEAKEYYDDNTLAECFGDNYSDYALEKACDLYVSIYQRMNPHFQKVMQGVILNHASLRGLNPSTKNIPESITPSEATYHNLYNLSLQNYLTLTSKDKTIAQGLLSSKL